jgi:DNA polymerase-1
LLFEAPSGEHSELEALVRQIMEAVLPLRVPLKVNTAWGMNWDEAH